MSRSALNLTALWVSATLGAAALSGTWVFEFDPDTRGPIERSSCELKLEGRSLSGHCGSDRVPLMGAVRDRRVTFEIRMGDVTATFRGELDADDATLRGTWQQPDRHGRFTAHKR